MVLLGTLCVVRLYWFAYHSRQGSTDECQCGTASASKQVPVHGKTYAPFVFVCVSVAVCVCSKCLDPWACVQITSAGSKFSFADKNIFISNAVRNASRTRGLFLGDLVSVDALWNDAKQGWVASYVRVLKRNNTGYVKHSSDIADKKARPAAAGESDGEAKPQGGKGRAETGGKGKAAGKVSRVARGGEKEGKGKKLKPRDESDSQSAQGGGVVTAARTGERGLDTESDMGEIEALLAEGLVDSPMAKKKKKRSRKDELREAPEDEVASAKRKKRIKTTAASGAVEAVEKEERVRKASNRFKSEGESLSRNQIDLNSPKVKAKDSKAKIRGAKAEKDDKKAKDKMRDSLADKKGSKTKSTSPRADNMLARKKKSRE